MVQKNEKMAKVDPKFKLKNVVDDIVPTLIIMKVYYRTKRYTYSTGEKIAPQYWNADDEHAIEKGLPANIRSANSDINFILDQCRGNAIRLFDHYRIQKYIPNPEEYKKHMDKELNRKPPPEAPREPDFFAFVDEYIHQSSITKKPGVIRGYRDTRNKLVNFEQDTHYKLTFRSINLKFYYKFVDYLAKKGVGLNTIGQKHIKNLKAILHAADRRSISINKEVDDPEFKKLSAETDKIYLTEDEVKLLYELDLTNNKRLDRVRDVFLLGCKTAKRFGDYSILRKEHLKEHEGKFFIDMRMQKTGGRVVVPVSRIVLEILEKYEFDLPRKITNQKTNNYLKELGKLAGIDAEEVYTEYVGLERKSVIKKRFEMITTHTARRTGATNMYLAGIPSHSIMKLTGHKTEKEFLRYIRADELVHAMHMAKNPYFDD
jgi:hypothetical protein